jgi:hypothetical protein
MTPSRSPFRSRLVGLRPFLVAHEVPGTDPLPGPLPVPPEIDPGPPPREMPEPPPITVPGPPPTPPIQAMH